MLTGSRRALTPVLAAALAVTGLGLLTAPAAHAVVDPFSVGACLATAATELTTVVDPAAPSVPAEVPAVSCLHP
ncbi:hypothetical protein [Nonomuraea sp. NPDC050783]|uniref:hypothetical protein n=1 Tax=Nonomuraea sp. NPDC050783 TaxID=3154634 RepID=UPI0034653C36